MSAFNADTTILLSPIDRIRDFVDHESFKEFDSHLTSINPLQFKDKLCYSERLKKAQERTKNKDAIVCGEALVDNIPIQIAVFDYNFMGGSMGTVVGEKISRTFRRSIEKKQAAIVFSASGGARMQEGVLSLMQMAKTCSMLRKLREETNVPMISILTNPTTGGVSASFALLGDINIAEPKALIGFAGPRVIKQTIGEELPEGFQTSEYLQQNGMIDIICQRSQLREKVSQILTILSDNTSSKDS